MIIYHGKSHDKTSNFEVAYFKYFQANRLGGNLVEHHRFFISIESWRKKEATCHFLHFDVCFSDGSHEFCRQTRILWHRIKLDVELIPVCEFLWISNILCHLVSTAPFWEEKKGGRFRTPLVIIHLLLNGWGFLTFCNHSFFISQWENDIYNDHLPKFGNLNSKFWGPLLGFTGLLQVVCTQRPWLRATMGNPPCQSQIRSDQTRMPHRN